MSQSGKHGYVIERFNWIEGLDSKQAEVVKNATTPVMKIQLLQNQKIQYADTDNVGISITNKMPRTTDVVFFGSNIMYNMQDADRGFSS